MGGRSGKRRPSPEPSRGVSAIRPIRPAQMEAVVAHLASIEDALESALSEESELKAEAAASTQREGLLKISQAALAAASAQLDTTLRSQITNAATSALNDTQYLARLRAMDEQVATAGAAAAAALSAASEAARTAEEAQREVARSAAREAQLREDLVACQAQAARAEVAARAAEAATEAALLARSDDAARGGGERAKLSAALTALSKKYTDLCAAIEARRGGAWVTGRLGSRARVSRWGVSATTPSGFRLIKLSGGIFRRCCDCLAVVPCGADRHVLHAAPASAMRLLLLANLR